MLRTARRRIRWVASDVMSIYHRSNIRTRMWLFWLCFYAGNALIRWSYRRLIIVRVIPPAKRDEIVP